MYFRKYFKGELSSSTGAASITINGTSTRVTAYINQTKVINEAIKETLLAAGISCEYEEATAVLCVEGVFVQILATSKNGDSSLYIKGNASAVTALGSTRGINSGSDYKFYVTLVGEPKGILGIRLGWYSAPDSAGEILSIAKITDLRDASRKFGIFGSGNSMYIRDEQGEPLKEIDKVTFSYLTKFPELTNDGSLIPLIESIDTSGFFKIDHCYVGNMILEANRFYDIGGYIYFHQGYYFLIKCTTEISG
ncbi:MAG: hypothetical protein NC305_13270 [Lachnospiraceae bacterium]|nr:hypothetical protein [Butyrivibrio sp.]MCM1344032.1 hypothetical protein [Muribaculaceae bacterium]MCM1411501.1 hypothetical protein [Lachnospiraceae bacterium]